MCLRVLKGITHDPLGTLAGKDNGLDSDLVGGSLSEPAADTRVLAFGILAHTHHVDLGRTLAGEWAADAGQEAHWPQVHILVEALADWQQQAPQRDVVRYSRIADRTEQDGIEPTPL